MYFCSMKRLLIIAFTLLTSITPSKAYEIISLGAALDIYKSGLATIAEQTLAGLSYDYFGQDPNGTHYWAQGCRLNSNFELSSTMDATKLPLGASIVRFNPNDSEIGLQVKVFHEQDIRRFSNFLELSNYTYRTIDEDLHVYAWKQNQSDTDEHPVYMVMGKIYADNIYHGYVIIFGGEVSPPVEQVRQEYLSGKNSSKTDEPWLGIFKSIVLSDVVIYGLIALAVIIILFLLTGGKLSQIGYYIRDLVMTVVIAAILYAALYISMHIGVYVALFKNVIPDYRNMFIVINGFSVVGFISGIIGMFWNAVWAGASVAFPVALAGTAGADFCKTSQGRLGCYLVVVVIAIYASYESYCWVTTTDNPFWGSTMMDYYTLSVAHVIGALAGLFFGAAKKVDAN